MKALRRTLLSENQLIRVETAIGLRAAVAGLAHSTVYIAFRQLTPFSGPIPMLVNVAGILIFLVCLARWALVYIQKAYYPDPVWRKRWRFLFRTASLSLALSWSMASIGTFENWGLTFPFLMPVIIILGIASIAVQAFGLDLRFTQLFILLILGPTIATLFYSRLPGSVGLGFVLSTAMGYLIFLANSSFRLLYEALENREVIQSQRDQLTAVLDAIPGYVFWTDLDGHYLGLNRRLTEAYRIPPSFVLKNRIGTVIANDPLTAEVHEFLTSSDSERLSETSFRLPDGLRHCLLAMRKYQGATGTQAVVIVLDTEDRKRAQQELEKTRAQAFESARLAALGVMAGGIAHEINNPLQVIRALAELLRKDSIDVPRAATKIEATTDRVAKIIAGLRSFARVGQSYPLEIVEVELLINEVVDLARVSQPRYRIPIEVSPVSPKLTVESRRTEIGQVLINLLNNAIDAVTGQENPWIRIATRDLSSQVEITIENSGPKIPDSISEKIMLPFFTTKEIGKGTGLGLSISKSIAEGHEGSLQLDKTAAATRFVLTLPKRQKASNQRG